MSRLSFGWLVAAALAVNVALFVVMIFGPLAHLSELADGAEPFDLRPLGYSLGDARALLDLLGDEGRVYYARAQLALDSIYPATYALSRGLLLWWLTMPERQGGALPIAWRVAMLALPLLASAFDYFENARIAAILMSGPNLDASLVASASLATQAKSLLSFVTEALVIVLAVRAVLHWRKAPSKVGPRASATGDAQH